LFWHRDNIPELLLAHEPHKSQCLNPVVVKFSHVALLDVVIDKVTIRLVGGIQVLFE
jgi:hypothetical protein